MSKNETERVKKLVSFFLTDNIQSFHLSELAQSNSESQGDTLGKLKMKAERMC